MQILRAEMAEASQARGIVIVIDVIRAFTVAGYAIAGGAQGIWLVRTVEDAQALRQREPQALLIGEIGGRLIPGFDLNNSPSLMAKANVQKRQLIQRTGAGTQGAVNAANAAYTLLCAYTNARATATYARSLALATGEPITLLPTNAALARAVNEDHLCADYVEALLLERNDALDIANKGIEQLQAVNRLDGWAAGDADFPAADIDAIFATDRFNFAIRGSHQRWKEITYVDAQRVNLISVQ